MRTFGQIAVGDEFFFMGPDKQKVGPFLKVDNTKFCLEQHWDKRENHLQVFNVNMIVYGEEDKQ